MARYSIASVLTVAVLVGMLTIDITPAAAARHPAARKSGTSEFRSPPDAVAPTPQAPAHPLDLAGLEKRLRDTKAIGMFAKLSLKNQVDDFIEQFREFHLGRGEATLDELRERYNLLMLKVLSLLQKHDPRLARDLSASREAIWTVLIDPVAFAKASGGG